MSAPRGIGNHIDVRVGATVLRVACSNFEHRGVPTGFVYQVMAIGFTELERSAVSGVLAIWSVKFHAA